MRGPNLNLRSDPFRLSFVGAILIAVVPVIASAECVGGGCGGKLTTSNLIFTGFMALIGAVILCALPSTVIYIVGRLYLSWKYRSESEAEIQERTEARKNLKQVALGGGFLFFLMILISVFAGFIR